MSNKNKESIHDEVNYVGKDLFTGKDIEDSGFVYNSINNSNVGKSNKYDNKGNNDSDNDSAVTAHIKESSSSDDEDISDDDDKEERTVLHESSPCEDGVKINLPWLDANYDWKQLMPKSFFNKGKKQQRIEVAPDLFDPGCKMTFDQKQNRCLYLCLKMNNNNINRCGDELETLVEKMRITIQLVLCKFMMEVATMLEFGNSDELAVDSYDDPTKVIEGAKKFN